MSFKDKLKMIKKPDKEAERKLREDIANEGGLEKGDVPAMIISAFLMIVLPIAAVLGGLGFLAWLLFS